MLMYTPAKLQQVMFCRQSFMLVTVCFTSDKSLPKAPTTILKELRQGSTS